MKTTILKTLVGSRAHGLHDENSDYDYRGVFVYSTNEILSLFPPKESTNWIEAGDDNTSWEIAHFLRLSFQCNPTILETFKSPIIESTDLSQEMLSLFPYFYNKDLIRDAFIGYGHNQRKKMLENRENRPRKYAIAYLRTLYNAEHLLHYGDFTMSVVGTPIEETLRAWKNSELPFSYGEAINTCITWENLVNDAYLEAPKELFKPDREEVVNNFLLKVRKYYL